MNLHKHKLTYGPKIQAVRTGICTQTTRLDWDKQVGDLIMFYDDDWQTPIWKISHVYNINVYDCGISLNSIEWEHRDGCTYHNPRHNEFYDWKKTEEELEFPQQDFINPPTGEAFRDVLEFYYGKLTGQKMQVIKWRIEQ